MLFLVKQELFLVPLFFQHNLGFVFRIFDCMVKNPLKDIAITWTPFYYGKGSSS